MLTDHDLENISQQCMRAVFPPDVVEVDATPSGPSFMLCRPRIQPTPVSRLPFPVSRVPCPVTRDPLPGLSSCPAALRPGWRPLLGGESDRVFNSNRPG